MDASSSTVAETMSTDGFAVIPNVLDDATIEFLLGELAQFKSALGVKQRGSSFFGIRNLLNAVPAIRQLADSPTVRSLIEPIIGTQGKVVRGIFFDKTPEANWKVTWHQDLTIAVRQQLPVDGFTGWSLKAGITHVQPTVSVLEMMLTIRIHLDDADETNGALKVIPGTHKLGRITSGQLEHLRQTAAPVLCSIKRGGALLMKPLLLHSSSQAVVPSHRRVIHLEFASGELPGNLEWFGS